MQHEIHSAEIHVWRFMFGHIKLKSFEKSLRGTYWFLRHLASKSASNIFVHDMVFCNTFTSLSVISICAQKKPGFASLGDEIIQLSLVQVWQNQTIINAGKKGHCQWNFFCLEKSCQNDLYCVLFYATTLLQHFVIKDLYVCSNEKYAECWTAGLY